MHLLIRVFAWFWKDKAYRKLVEKNKQTDQGGPYQAMNPMRLRWISF